MSEKDESDQHRRVLVDQVKSNQRASAPFAKTWRSYCDSHGDGFYDPARHSTQFLEDFLKYAAEKRGGSKDDESSSSRRSRSPRSRRNGRHRTRHGRRHDRGRTRRKGRLRRRSDSRSRSGIPTRKTAIKGAERAVAAFTKELEELKGISDDSEPVEHSEQPNQDLQLSRWRAEVEAERAAQVSEAERKLQEEKAARLKEAEEKLDQAIAERLQEAEEKLRAEVHSRLDDAQRHAEAKVKMFMEDVCPKIESSWAEQMKGLALKARDARAAVLHLAQEAG